MAANTISCPECHVTLKVAGTPPRGQGARVTCPRCGSQFSMTADAFRPAAWVPPESTPAIPPVRSQLAEEDVEPPRNLAWRTFFPALLLAIAAACFVVGASIFAAVHFSGNREPAAQQTPPALVVEKPPEPRPKQEDTEQERKAKEKELREFTSLMIQAGIAKSSKRYDDAVKAYGDALKLFPDDAEAAQGLRESQAALSAKADTKADDEKRRAEFERLMKQGEEAMTAKKFAEAVRAFEVAIQVMPSRAEATKAAQQAKAALDKDQGERKKLAEYRDRMTAGRAAMVDERYGDAVREFVAALGLLPGDAAATKGRRDAQKMVRAAADEDKHKDDFTRLMDQAGAALRNHRYEEAVRRYRAALKLSPKDGEAKQGLRDARKALGEAKESYALLMNQGDNAMLLQRYQSAVRAYRGASNLFPDDERANDSLRQAEQALDAAGTAVATYAQSMALGARALRAHRYAEAVRAFSAALTLVPDDPDAAQGLRDAQAGLDKHVNNRTDFDKQMRAGLLAYKKRSYAEAVQAFEAALQIDPDSNKASSALSQARYAQYMSDGQAAMNARRYQDAVRAFQAALDAMPGDPRAAAALRQAQQFKK